jgi:hypothetical protein
VALAFRALQFNQLLVEMQEARGFYLKKFENLPFYPNFEWTVPILHCEYNKKFSARVKNGWGATTPLPPFPPRRDECSVPIVTRSSRLPFESPRPDFTVLFITHAL